MSDSFRQCNPNLKAVTRTVYNAKAKILEDNLGGRTMIQALLEELGSNGFAYDVSRQLGTFVFCSSNFYSFNKKYSNVFVMDCTYKTNKYKMPLLDIIGVSSFNTLFYSCFAFLQKEEEDDYVCALRKFSSILGVNC